MRRRLRIEKVVTEHREGGVARWHDVSDPRGPFGHRDGARSAIRRVGTSARQPPRSSTGRCPNVTLETLIRRFGTYMLVSAIRLESVSFFAVFRFV